ncbi:response regulator transcription factor [Arcobacter sp. YIC-464]|uniref:response regulator transcription factor n=1 Tax=Arcobacter sp. YIC-464 TaxID=3376631 RepID=UPI003C14FA47
MIDYILLEKYSQNINVLFVEDDEFIRKETKELLEDIFQKEITIAVDGKDGFEKYMDYFTQNNKYFDLVITDIKMPNMDGIELTKLIYNQNKNQSLIVLSAHNESDYLMQLINLGISQFILKPIDYDNFVEVIYKVSKDIYSSDKVVQSDVLDNPLIKLTRTLVWDKQNKQLLENDENIKLTKKEYLLFDLLLKVPEKTCTNEEILMYLWKDDEDKSPDITNLKNIISRLRKKVPELRIENIYSLGYRINILP